MNRKHIISIFLLGSVVLSGGCRKDLCYDHDRHGLTTRALILPEWEQEWERDYGMGWQENWPDKYGIHYDSLRPDVATGIATYVYHQDQSRSTRHLPAEGGRITDDE